MENFDIGTVKFSQLPLDLKARAINAVLCSNDGDLVRNTDFLAFLIHRDAHVFGMFSLEYSPEGWDFWEKALLEVCENTELLDKVGLN